MNVAQKKLIDPRVHVVPTTIQWNKIVNELQKLVYNIVPRNGKMCKNKWNEINLYFKIFFYYHKGT
jgi:hypothetical protein